MYRCTKVFRGYPCAHRRYAHGGHCRLVHGYDRTFVITFEARELESGTDFVMDFGDLKDVSQWLAERFDHTLLVDRADPLLCEFERLEELGACKLVVLESVGMEGTARYVYEGVSRMIKEKTRGRVSVYGVECRENEKNSATYYGVFNEQDID